MNTVDGISNASGAITLTGDAPDQNGGSAITGYDAECTSQDGGTGNAASVLSPPITVTGLTNGKLYQCRGGRTTRAVVARGR